MDNSKLILTETVSPPDVLPYLDKIKKAPEETKKQFAKDFESILINKMLDEMKNTIGSWGFEEDGTSQQIQGLFSLFLSQYIGNNGGFGLWEQIYESLKTLEQNDTTVTETAGDNL